MRVVLFLFWLFFLSISVHATIIYGTDTTYAGQRIDFCIQANPIIGKDSVLSGTVVNANGTFFIEIDIYQTCMVYAYTGINKIILFAEPGKKYEVILPPYTPKTKADNLNPFFQPVETILATKNLDDNDINMQIRMFNDSYIPYYNKHLNKVFTDRDFETLDKDILLIEKPFSKSGNIFFNDYRNYKYGMLRMLAYQHKSKAISDYYFKGKPFLYNNPAYTDLFNMVYDKYFTYFSRADSENKLSRALATYKTYDSVVKILREDEVLQPDELLNMVLLKSLYDEFYKDNYSRQSMLEVLNSFIKNVSSETQVAIAKDIKKKVTLLLAGYFPPGFGLYDKDSNIVTLEKFRGRYVYLNFCACYSYSCLNEFTMLQKLYEKHKNYLEIVTIIIDEDVQSMKEFISQSGYSWTFLHFDLQKAILREYDIRALPTYFLIDNMGKLVISPAPSPAEEFEGRLFKELRAKGIL